MLWLLVSCTPHEPGPEVSSPIFEACGEGAWGVVPVDESTLRVDPSASGGGDGSADAPYSSLSDALSDARTLSDPRIALAGGTYDGPFSFRSFAHLEVAGRCPELVLLTGTGDDPVITISVGNDGEVLLSGLTVTAGTGGGIDLLSGHLAASSINIVGATGIGLLASNSASALLEDVSIAGTSPGEDSSRPGIGLAAIESAVVEAVGLSVVGNTYAGVFVQGAEVEIRDSEILDTEVERRRGFGLFANASAQVHLRGTEIARNFGFGVAADGDGTALSLEDCRVAETVEESGSRGLVVSAGATATVLDSVIDANAGGGIIVSSAELQLERTQIADNYATETDGGAGIGVQGGATVFGVDVSLSRNAGVGLYVEGADSVVEFLGLEVLDTLGEPGRGAELHDGQLIVSGGSIARNREDGVFVSAGYAHLSDVEILDTLPDETGYSGRGLEAKEGATVSLVDVRIQGNNECGFLLDASYGVLSNVEVLETRYASDEVGVGRGIAIQNGATLTMTGGRISGNQELGLFAAGEVDVSLTDVEISESLPHPSGRHGRGLSFSDGANVRLELCTIADNHEAGITVGSQATMEIIDSEIRGTRLTGAYAAAVGIESATAGVVRASGLVVSGNAGPGLFVVAGGAMSCQDCTLEENGFAGAAVLDGELELLGSRVIQSGAVGVWTSSEWGLPAVLVEDTEIGAHPYAGVWMSGGGRVELLNDTIAGGEGVALRDDFTIHGNAIYAERGAALWDGDQGLLVTGTVLGAGAGPAVLLNGASANVEGNTWDIGTDVSLVQQLCDGMLAPGGADEAPSAEICTGTTLLTEALLFAVFFDDSAVLSE